MQMRGRGRRTSVVVGVVLAALAASACGAKDCSSVGYQSGVSITLPTQEWVLAEFCVGTQCLPPEALLNHDGFVSLQDEPAEYTYRVRMVKPDVTEIAQEGTVRTTKFRGNGAGCDPVTANAVLHVDDDGKVTLGSP